MNIDPRIDALRQSLDTPEQLVAGRLDDINRAVARGVREIEVFLTSAARIEPLPLPPISRPVYDFYNLSQTGQHDLNTNSVQSDTETTQQMLVADAQQAANQAYINPLFDGTKQ